MRRIVMTMNVMVAVSAFKATATTAEPVVRLVQVERPVWRVHVLVLRGLPTVGGLVLIPPKVV